MEIDNVTIIIEQLKKEGLVCLDCSKYLGYYAVTYPRKCEECK